MPDTNQVDLDVNYRPNGRLVTVLRQVSRLDIMARYDWLVDFGDVAPQIPPQYQQPTPGGRLHRHLIRPVIADDLPTGATLTIRAKQDIKLEAG